MNIDNLTPEEKERMCELCQDIIFEYRVNTRSETLCEGSQCDGALELLEEDLDESNS